MTRFILLCTALVALFASATAADAGRLYLRQGYSVEADQWWASENQDGMLYYSTHSGETRAVTRTDVVRIENVPPRPEPASVIIVKGRCREPHIGDPLAVVKSDYFKCLGVTPPMRTQIRDGRQITLYGVQGSFGMNWYAFVNDRLWQIEAGARQ